MQKLSKVTLAKERRSATVSDMEQNAGLLIKRQSDAINMHNGMDASSRDTDCSGSQEDAAVLIGSSIPTKNAVRPIKLPEVKKLPPYTTWIFLDRYAKDNMYFKFFLPLKIGEIYVYVFMQNTPFVESIR